MERARCGCFARPPHRERLPLSAGYTKFHGRPIVDVTEPRAIPSIVLTALVEYADRVKEHAELALSVPSRARTRLLTHRSSRAFSPRVMLPALWMMGSPRPGCLDRVKSSHLPRAGCGFLIWLTSRRSSSTSTTTMQTRSAQRPASKRSTRSTVPPRKRSTPIQRQVEASCRPCAGAQQVDSQGLRLRGKRQPFRPDALRQLGRHCAQVNVAAGQGARALRFALCPAGGPVQPRAVSADRLHVNCVAAACSAIAKQGCPATPRSWPHWPTSPEPCAPRRPCTPCASSVPSKRMATGIRRGRWWWSGPLP